MRITFLDHSGFLVELPSATLLFDWWKGALPALRTDVPLVVFASHWHEDHFSPAIFSLNADAYVLGDMDQRWLARKGASPEVLEKCRSMSGHETAELLGGVTVETLPSTDEGVAFLVTCGGKIVFHAGDLNWWHWEGEPDHWNPDMERNFKAYSAPLKGRDIDLAFLLLDPRQETDGFRGIPYFMELANIQQVIPMHQWGNFAFTHAFLAQYPQYTGNLLPVVQTGQVFDL
jgi:hypothetical protein